MSRRRRPGPGRGGPAVAFCGLALSLLSSVAVAHMGEERTGGATTVFDTTPTAFGRALANLDALRWNDFRAGKERFLRQWPQRGPWADAAACVDCHFRDGRGPQPDQMAGGRSHLLRLGRSSAGGDPIYGIQLRRTGVGVPAPGQFDVRWEEISGRYASGEPYQLRRPLLKVRALAYGPLDSDMRTSLRVPPAVFGLGLLEAVPEDEVLASADTEDVDGDGVSGRPHRVRDPLTGETALGRFGWKGSQPSLAAQSAAALLHDIGVTSALCSSPAWLGDADCEGTEPEIDESELAALVQYLRALAVPARRRWTEPSVLHGEKIFVAIGCSDCHRRRLTTGHLPDWPELSGQTIHPYTDMLLHDMGPQLADGVSEGEASGSEWRSPPLWGLGLLQTVSGSVGLLHDGRARSPEEAILWHGGEAQRARDRFTTLRREEREALMEFLATL